MHKIFWSVNLKITDQLFDLSLNVRITLKWILKKWGGGGGALLQTNRTYTVTNFKWLRIGSVKRDSVLTVTNFGVL
jgi:hypothetical protein